VAGERVAQQLLDEQDDEAALGAEPIDLEKLELLPIELPAEAEQADGWAEE
jgi:hypothetical protein